MPRSGKIISGCIINLFHIFSVYYSDYVVPFCRYHFVIVVCRRFNPDPLKRF